MACAAVAISATVSLCSGAAILCALFAGRNDDWNV